MADLAQNEHPEAVDLLNDDGDLRVPEVRRKPAGDLLPHLLGNWALNVSDRIVLDGIVSKTEIGIYTLGYQFGMLLKELRGCAAAPDVVGLKAQRIKHPAFPAMIQNAPDIGVGLATRWIDPSVLWNLRAVLDESTPDILHVWRLPALAQRERAPNNLCLPLSHHPTHTLCR